MAKTAAKKAETLTVDAQKTVVEGVEKMTKGIENAATFGQENVEAVVASSKIAAKAAEQAARLEAERDRAARDLGVERTLRRVTLAELKKKEEDYRGAMTTIRSQVAGLETELTEARALLGGKTEEQGGQGSGTSL